MRIVLVGFMATGKSVVGKRLAMRRGLGFVDIDSLIEQDAGLPVREIFALRGEAEFRVLEKKAVHEACRRSDVVIATGGGAVLDGENRANLEASGLLFCLTARPQEILRRLGPAVKDRPLLSGYDDLLQRIGELQQERAAVYGTIPHRVDTSNLDVSQVVEAIDRCIEEVRRDGGGAP